MARQQFLDTYNKELERIYRDREEAAARAATATPSDETVTTTTPSSSEVSDDSAVAASEHVSNDDGGETDQEDDALIVSGKTESDKSGEVGAQALPVPTSDNQQASGEYAGSVIQDEDADSIVISAKGQDEEQVPQPQSIDVRSNLPDPSYQITIPIGVGGSAQLSVQHNPALAVARGQEEQEQVSSGNNMIGQGEQSQQQVPAKSNLQRKTIFLNKFIVAIIFNYFK